MARRVLVPLSGGTRVWLADPVVLTLGGNGGVWQAALGVKRELSPIDEEETDAEKKKGDEDGAEA
jgi:hypothetical protein